MSVLHIPPGGVSLLPSASSSTSDPKPRSEPPQVIRLELIENATKDILRLLRNNEQVRLRTGKKLAINLGNRTIDLTNTTDNFPSELYSRSSSSPNQMYFSGKFSHALEVRKAQEATAATDTSLANLENTLKSLQEQRASNEASFVRSRDDMRQVGKKDIKPLPLNGRATEFRKDRLLGSAPASPFMSAFSPRSAPTSVPLSSSVFPSKDKLRLDAMRIPLLHLLASEPQSIRSLADKIKAPRDDCERVLDKIAWDCKGMVGKKELKDKCYRDLDIWKFPYASQAGRQAAIDHAIHAYDRMRIDKNDPLWQMLLPSDERGKGKTLSRLNFDKPVPVMQRPESETRTEESDREGNKKGQKSKDPVKAPSGVSGPKKKQVDKDVRPKATEHVGVSRPRDATAATSKPVANADTKFKSSERIEDSDEEAEAANTVVARPVNAPIKRKHADSLTVPGSPARPVSPSPQKMVHKASVSSSSGGSTTSKVSRSSTQNGRSLTAEKTLPGSVSRISPRPRNGSSPQKPSPLASSPPANSTDMDNSSSGKASSHSSASSSPPSSTDIPLSRTAQKFSPIIRERDRSDSQSRLPPKRKADVADEQPSAKRQQVNHGSTGVRRPVYGQNLDNRPNLARQISESERSSSSDKPVQQRSEVIEDAKHFQRYYRKYKDMHGRIAQIDERDRNDKDLEDLWRMHNRLKELKADIWSNWTRVEQSVKAN